jgi:hypothetical protein
MSATYPKRPAPKHLEEFRTEVALLSLAAGTVTVVLAAMLF